MRKAVPKRENGPEGPPPREHAPTSSAPMASSAGREQKSKVNQNPLYNMKILQVIPVFSNVFGGPVTIVRKVSNELVKKNVVITYTTTAINPYLDTNEKKIVLNKNEIYFFKRNFKKLSYLHIFGQLNISFSMMRYIQNNIKNFDVVHIYSYQQFPDLITSYFAKKNGIPYIVQVNGSLIPDKSKFWRKFIFNYLIGYNILKNASKVVAISENEVKQYLNVGVDRKKISLISPGVDNKQFLILPKKGIFKNKLNIDLNKKIILYLGRINRTKGLNFLVESYYHFIKKYKYEDILLVISGINDGYISELNLLINKYNLYNKVIITGGLTEDEKIHAFIDSEIIVNVEPKNVYGLVPLEAAACGKPVIVTEGNEINNIVKRGDFGFIIKYGDVDSLAYIFTFIYNDRFLLDKKGKNGRRYVLTEYSWEKITVKLENEYRKLLSK